MQLSFGRALLIAALFASPARAQMPWQPFPIDWERAAETAVDLSGFLDAPAGREGFIRVQGPHLVKPDGTRFRIWGVNLSARDCFPEPEDAPRLAADLARLGVNCVRFHHMDADWGRGLIDARRDDTRHLDPENLDRLDVFVAELKRRGIYSNLNLNVVRLYKAGDGVRDFQALGIGKSATYFNARLIELQREFARQLLTHKNPYTGREYRHEPAVAVVEIVNENSVLEGWAQGRLSGAGDWRGGTWAAVPPSYADELTDQYNRWLEGHLPASQLAAIRREAGVAAGGLVPRLKPAEFAAASRDRFHAEVSFCMDVERGFLEGMKQLLKDELGVGSLVVGPADHNDSVSGYPHIASNLLLDVVDGHGYWEHPDTERQSTRNTPMVNDPLDSTVVQFARTPVVGRPFTISEINHPFPHRYASEGFPILTAYAQFHDWDGIYWFHFGPGRRAGPAPGVRDWFAIGNDPVKRANLTACALMWHRHDVQPARRTIVRSYSRDQVIEGFRLDRREQRPFFTPGFARSTPLQHATRFALDGTPATDFPPPAPPGRIESDTGQLVWSGADRKRGLVTIRTDQTEGRIGFFREAGDALPHLSTDLRTDFGSLVLTSLDGASLERSARMLLVATAGVANTGLRWGEDGQTVADWGTGPMVIEPVAGRVTVRALRGARGLRVRPLRPEGRPMEAELAAGRDGDGWAITLGDPATTWFLIEVLR